MSDVYVVDASVAIKLFVDEPDSPKAWRLFWRLAEPDPVQLFAPDLLYAECANILWKYSQRFGYNADLAQEHLQDLVKLEIEAVPTRELCTKAYEMAGRLGITAYDACYVILAQWLDCPLVTADEELVKSIPQQVAKTQWLRDY